MKLLSLLMALLLALTTLTAFAEDEFIGSVDAETMTVATLSGYVLDVQEELLLVKTPDGLYVEVLLTEETASEGADVLVGDFVQISVEKGMELLICRASTGCSCSSARDI